jgi:hypothetical protein
MKFNKLHWEYLVGGAFMPAAPMYRRCANQLGAYERAGFGR